MSFRMVRQYLSELTQRNALQAWRHSRTRTPSLTRLPSAETSRFFCPTPDRAAHTPRREVFPRTEMAASPAAYWMKTRTARQTRTSHLTAPTPLRRMEGARRRSQELELTFFTWEQVETPSFRKQIRSIRTSRATEFSRSSRAPHFRNR